MILYRTIEISQGLFTEEIQEMTQNTDIIKFRYNENNFYGLVQKVKPDIELGIIAKEIYKILKTNNPLEETEAKGFTDSSDYKIFLYGEKNEFINNTITKIDTDSEVGGMNVTQRAIFDDPETIGFSLDYELLNNIPSFSIGDTLVTKVTPKVSLLTETNEEFEIKISNIDCSQTGGILEFKENMLELIDPDTILEQFPVDTYAQKIVPVIISYTVDEVEKTFKTDICINICNKTQIRANFENSVLDSECLFMAVADVDDKTTFATQDIDFLANAIFEIDGKLLAIQTHLGLEDSALFSESLAKSTMSIERGVNFMAEMWARWIQTGRRTFDQCPKQYREEVKQLLADIGLDENGRPLEK